MSKPIISIIIPCYNSRNTIIHTLDSVFNQIKISENEYEVVVIDDCSKDGTLNLVKKSFKTKELSHVKLLSLSKNRGVSFARNIGIHHSSGDWIVFLDSDDELNREALSHIHSYVCGDYKACDLLAFGYEVITKKFRKDYTAHSYGNQVFLGNEFIKLFLSKKINLHISAMAYKKSFLINQKILFKDGQKIAEDLCFIIKCLNYAKNIFYSEYKLFKYQVFNSTAMKQYEYYTLDMAKSVLELSELVSDLHSDENKQFFDFYLVNFFAYNLLLIRKSRRVSKNAAKLLLANLPILKKKIYPLNLTRYIFLRLIQVFPVRLYIEYRLGRKIGC